MCLYVEQFYLGGTGLKVAVKDSIDVAGYPTKAGSEALDSVAPADKNAHVVDRIFAAGCQLVGKLNMHEFAFGMTGVNQWTGTPTNYLYPDYIPGGSSSGSAVAVAQGDVDFSLGTDTGGSIRLPAACCGVYGLKPTFGRVSRAGIMPEETTLDCVGPFARSVEQLIQAMEIIDSSFHAVSDVGPIRLGRVGVKADSEVQAVIDQILSRIGLDQVAVELPSMEAAFGAGLTLINTEAWAACGPYLATGKVGSDVSTRLRAAQHTSDEEVAMAEQIKLRFNAEVDSALAQVDVLVMPTLPSFPLKREQALAGATDLAISALVRPFNLSGHPALSIPLKEAEGRPVGLQLIAAKGQDEFLCEVARVISHSINQ